LKTFDRRHRKIDHLVTADRRPSVPVSDLHRHFFTAK
jgi:hypothetical protein